MISIYWRPIFRELFRVKESQNHVVNDIRVYTAVLHPCPCSGTPLAGRVASSAEKGYLPFCGIRRRCYGAVTTGYLPVITNAMSDDDSWILQVGFFDKRRNKIKNWDKKQKQIFLGAIGGNPPGQERRWTLCPGYELMRAGVTVGVIAPYVHLHSYPLHCISDKVNLLRV